MLAIEWTALNAHFVQGEGGYSNQRRLVCGHTSLVHCVRVLQQQAALKEEYEKKKAPFFKSRYEVVTNAEGGIPNFWLTTLQNNYIIAEEIQQVCCVL